MFITLISTVASLVLYGAGAIAALKLKLNSITHGLIVVGVIYALWTFYGAGLEACLWSLALARRWLADPLDQPPP